MADETSSAPVFRHVTAADAERVLPVLLAAFPQWPPFEIDVPPIDHLRWKMSPTGQPGDLHGTSELDGRVLGVQLRWMGRVELRGHVHQSAWTHGPSTEGFPRFGPSPKLPRAI